MSSAKAILSLTGDAYNGCILTSHMLEALIQLVWLLDREERIKQYIDFGVIEQLEGLHLHPEKKEQILKILALLLTIFFYILIKSIIAKSIDNIIKFLFLIFIWRR